ncbi:hypothetical protein lerEdw1_000967 [Lerista edwardsae]|nr:hypothetical protein lerEdw1_000967 [Lerista edwardsae]
MTAASCGGANDEFDFRLIFGEDGQPGPGPPPPTAPQPLGPVHAAAATAATADLEPDDCSSVCIFNVEHSSSVNHPICIPCHGYQSHPSPLSSPTGLQGHKNYEGTCELPESKYSSLGGPKPFECPSIQITSISPNCHQGIEANENELHANGPQNEYMERPSRDHLYLPLEPSYRESSLSPSPASSISSRSWFSDASSCESISHIYDDVDSELNEAAARFTLGSPLASPGGSPRGCPVDEPWQQFYGFGHALSPRQSPCHSPRTSITDENWLSPRPTSRPSSRPTSPCGKRRHSSAEICYVGSLSPHHSPTPSPGHSPRGSITEDTWLNSSLHGLTPGLSPFQCCADTDIPLKTRKTSEDQTAIISGKIEICSEDPSSLSPSVETAIDDSSGSQHTLKKDLPGDQFLSVPSHFTWNKPKPGHTPIFRTSSLPPLDWPLSAQYGQCELKIEVQPKTHHRAHYETEGSRGAVKASTGGHPVVKLLGYSEKPVNLQMFIGTADDRYLRPHAFYQVHRITGKTVATASQEIIITSTKVLEIPLLPENNMSASIDCAGILKLRNSDIELRKGETDIGRKNTRVRLVFRVHIPQPSGKVLSLQVASIPVECSQRSAQELPQIEKYSINSCLVNGGHEMVVTGSNFLPESKVIFLEKGQDGRPQWEVEGKIIRERSQEATIVLEVPSYHNKTITAAVQVQFYVCNGKRKKSQSQRFTYTPVVLKQENRDEMDLSSVQSLALTHCTGIKGHSSLQTQLPSSDPGLSHDSLLSTSPRSLVCPIQQTYTPMVSSTVSQLSHIQGRNISPGEEHQVLSSALVHQSFQVTSAPSARPSYQPMQSNVMFNGQSGLPINSASSSQGYDAISFQQDSAIPPLINLSCQSLPSMPYHSSNPDSVSTSATAGGHPSAHPAQPRQSSPHLQSMGYHCPNPQQAPVSSPVTQSLGHHSTQLQQVSYHSSNPEGAAVNIKPEPEDPELNFQTIGLQDITLDDVNEIIGRDMSQISVSHGAGVTIHSPHTCPASLEAAISDGVQ